MEDGLALTGVGSGFRGPASASKKAGVGRANVQVALGECDLEPTLGEGAVDPVVELMARHPLEGGVVWRLDFHSFRRAWVTTAVRAGVPNMVGMRVTGHKTLSMYQHYQEQAVGDDLHAVVACVHQRRAGPSPKSSPKSARLRDARQAQAEAAQGDQSNTTVLLL